MLPHLNINFDKSCNSFCKQAANLKLKHEQKKMSRKNSCLKIHKKKKCKKTKVILSTKIHINYMYFR